MGLDMNLVVKDRNGVVDKDLSIYWRKANQLRQWFVDNIEELNVDDNCVPVKVTKENLKNLYDDITLVLKDHSCASEIMPTSQGFFFGSNEYDEGYFSTLERTAKFLNELLPKLDLNEYDIEYIDWW